MGLPVAPSLGPTLEAAHVARPLALVDGRVVFIGLLAVLVALAAGLIASLLTKLIGRRNAMAVPRRARKLPAC